VKDLTFQLVRGLHWTSRVIGYFGAGYYSHIDVLTPAGKLRGARSDVIQGIDPGYQDRPYNYEKWAAQTQYTISVSDEEYAAYWAYSDKQLGKPYDSRGLISTFVFGRNWRDDGQWFCSEEVAMNLQAAHVLDIPPEIDSVEPGDCAFLFAGLQAKRQEFVNWVATG
jgi:uncharacterized protein YycO